MFGMTDCKSVSTPMTVGAVYTNEQSPKMESEKQVMTAYPYNVLTSVLLWISGWSRPDCTSATRTFSRFISNLGMTHWVGAKGLTVCQRHNASWHPIQADKRLS